MNDDTTEQLEDSPEPVDSGTDGTQVEASKQEVISVSGEFTEIQGVANICETFKGIAAEPHKSIGEQRAYKFMSAVYADKEAQLEKLARQLQDVSDENKSLHQKVSQLEIRIAVLIEKLGIENYKKVAGVLGTSAIALAFSFMTDELYGPAGAVAFLGLGLLVFSFWLRRGDK